MLHQTSDSADKRQVRFGANATLMTLALLGILILINVLATRHHVRWDMTAERSFSLSPETLRIIENVKQPITIIGFFDRASKQMEEETASKLKEYTSRSSQITYRVVDPAIDPLAVKTYNVTMDRTLVFESGPNRQQVTSIDEEHLTGALFKVTQNTPTTVYFLTGHKERSLKASDPSDLSALGQALEQDNFRISPINLLISDTIPLDHTILLIAAPQTKFQRQEEQKISTYVARGGRLMVLANPLDPPPLTKFFASLGLTWNNDFLIDSQSAIGDALSPMLTTFPAHPITKDLHEQPAFFPMVRTITRTPDAPPELTITPLLESSAQSQAVTHFEGNQIRPTDQDAKGPLTFGYAIEGVITATAKLDPLTKPEKARIVMIGDSDFASNTYATQLGTANTDLFRSAIAWLSGEDQEQITLPPKPEPANRSLFLNTGQSEFVFYSSTLGLPLLVLLIGALVWWRWR